MTSWAAATVMAAVPKKAAMMANVLGHFAFFPITG
jgi:hypothetical protein